MSYESRLKGILTLHPTPSATTEEALSAALQGVGDPRAGWLVLLNGTVTPKDATHWEAARALLKHVCESVLLPLGLEARGTLLALGEDDRLLARLTVDGAAMEVRLEPSSDDDAKRSGWLASLRGKNTELRKSAVQHLGAWSDAEVLKALSRAAASDWEVSVRIAALETLGGLGEAAVTVLPTIAACLSDREPSVRYWAASALGRMGAAAKETLPALEALSSDREDGPRWGAQGAIDRIRTALSRDAFKLVVTHVESIQGRGTVVRGVMQGRLAVMDDVAVVHGNRFIMTRVGGIFLPPPHRTTLQVATTGDEVMLIIRNVPEKDLCVGCWVVPPGAAPLGGQRVLSLTSRR